MENDAIGILQFLATVYDKPMDARQIKAYADQLADVPADALRYAADQWTRTQKWFPKIAELRALAGKHQRVPTGGDAIIERLNHLYDLALDGTFEAEAWMKLIVQLRISDRESQADAWRKRYDMLRGDAPVDRYELAADWQREEAHA